MRSSDKLHPSVAKKIFAATFGLTSRAALSWTQRETDRGERLEPSLAGCPSPVRRPRQEPRNDTRCFGDATEPPGSAKTVDGVLKRFGLQPKVKESARPREGSVRGVPDRRVKRLGACP
jgi:hypothetical protein